MGNGDGHADRTDFEDRRIDLEPTKDHTVVKQPPGRASVEVLDQLFTRTHVKFLVNRSTTLLTLPPKCGIMVVEWRRSMKISPAVRWLIDKAKTQEEKAYAILGARPGPGTDLLIWPVEPMCGQWHVKGLTKAGDAFVARFYSIQPFNNYILAKLRREANDWKITYKVKLPYLSLAESALEPKS